MGSLSQPRKNAYMAQGLVAGLTLRLTASRRQNAEFLVTRFEHVSDTSPEMLVPMGELRQTPLTVGARVHGAYVSQKKRRSFVTEGTRNSSDGTIQYLRSREDSQRSEWRGSFRLTINKNAMPDDADANVPGISVGLSEGVSGSLGEGIEFSARMQVTMVDDPAGEQRNRRIHCQFTDISRADRDRVAKYLIRRQLEMRRRGQI